MNFVDQRKSRAERKLKYKLLKEASVHYQLRERARSWTWGHIIMLIRSNDFKNGAAANDSSAGE